MKRKYLRRTKKEWQRIIDQFQASGQSGPVYCKANNIPYASFCQWRQTLSGAQVATPGPADGSFVDLQPLLDRAGTWKIVLRLGADIELVLSRP